MSQVQYYYSVDGSEQGPFGPITSPLGSIPPNPTTAGILGIACNDTIADHSVDVSYNDFKIGTTGYGTSDIFSDIFSSSGFASWDDYIDGSPGVYLTEGSGIARLVFSSLHLIGSPAIELFAHDLDHDNVYWTMNVKCAVASDASSAKFEIYDPDSVFLMYFTDHVRFRVSGAVDETHAVDLDDGSFHTLGVRRERIADAIPDPVVYAISHTFGLDV